MIGNILFCSGLLLLAGCFSPQLAQAPLGEMEQEWAGFIKDAYPEWEAPKTLPETTATATPALESTSFEADYQQDDFIPIVEIDSPSEFSSSTGGVNAAPADLEIIQKVDAEKFDLYVIKKHDSLWRLANKYYNNGGKWKVIFDANRDVLKSPQSLQPGTEIRIPLP